MTKDNPYKASSPTDELPKPRGRVKRTFDILAVIFAGLPLLHFFLFLFIISPKRLSDIAEKQVFTGIVITAASYAILSGYPVSAVYNLIGVIGGRRTAYIGLALNVVTIAIYATGYFIKWDSPLITKTTRELLLW